MPLKTVRLKRRVGTSTSFEGELSKGSPTCGGEGSSGLVHAKPAPYSRFPQFSLEGSRWEVLSLSFSSRTTGHAVGEVSNGEECQETVCSKAYVFSQTANFTYVDHPCRTCSSRIIVWVELQLRIPGLFEACSLEGSEPDD